MAIEVVRKLQLAAQSPNVAKVTCTVEEQVANYVNNKKRRLLAQLEEQNDITVLVLGHEGLPPEHLQIQCEDAAGRELRVDLD
jgi:ribonuclease E